MVALDPNAAIFSELQTCEVIKKALLGYCKLDLVKPGDVELKFGVRNVRPLNVQAVKRLQHAFYMEGIRRNAVDTVIPIGLKKGEVNMKLVKPMGTAMEELANLADVLVTKGRVKIRPFSGQHRVEAMRTFGEYLKERKNRVILEVDGIDQQVKGVEAELEKEGLSAASTKGLNGRMEGLKRERVALMKDAARIKGLEGSGGEWVIEIYDVGELRKLE